LLIAHRQMAAGFETLLCALLRVDKAGQQCAALVEREGSSCALSELFVSFVALHELLNGFDVDVRDDARSAAFALAQACCESWMSLVLSYCARASFVRFGGSLPWISNSRAVDAAEAETATQLVAICRDLGWLQPHSVWWQACVRAACDVAAQRCVEHCCSAGVLPTVLLRLMADVPAGLEPADITALAPTLAADRSDIHCHSGVDHDAGDDSEGFAEQGGTSLPVCEEEAAEPSQLHLLRGCWLWAATAVLPWLLYHVVDSGCAEGGAHPPLLAVDAAAAAALCRLHRRVASHLLQFRLEGAFELLRDYPESLPGLLDLREVLAASPPQARERVAAALRTALASRLLVQGTPTPLLLDFLLAAQRALAALDPHQLLSPAVMSAIGRCLRERPDALRLIAGSLRGGGGGGGAGEEEEPAAAGELLADLLRGPLAGAAGGGGAASDFRGGFERLAGAGCGLPPASVQALLRQRGYLAERAATISTVASASAAGHSAASALAASQAGAAAGGGVPTALCSPEDATAATFAPFSHADDGSDTAAAAAAGVSAAGAGGGRPPASASGALSLLSGVRAQHTGRGAGGAGGSGGVTATVAPGTDEACAGLMVDDDGIGSEAGVEGEEGDADEEGEGGEAAGIQASGSDGESGGSEEGCAASCASPAFMRRLHGLAPLLALCLRSACLSLRASGVAAAAPARACSALADAVEAMPEMDAASPGAAAAAGPTGTPGARHLASGVLALWRPAPISGAALALGPHQLARTAAALTSLPGQGGADSSVVSPLALVVALFGGSCGPLLTECRRQLACTLLSLPHAAYDASSQERLLELLMARFGEGEAALLDCATMLRDCADSKRVSRDVAEAQEALAAAAADEGEGEGSEGDAPSLDLLLLSHHYWPALPKEQVRCDMWCGGCGTAALPTGVAG